MKISFWAKTAIAIAMAFCIFKIIDLRIQSSSQESYDKELQKQIDTYTASIEEKENILETPFTPEVIEEYANEHLGLYDPNVVIFANDQ